MTLVTCRDILKPARAGGYGVAGIDVLDPISTEGVIRAAEAMGQPVLLMVPEAALGMIDIDRFSLTLSRGQKLPQCPSPYIWTMVKASKPCRWPSGTASAR